MEVLRDTKEIEEDDGRTGTTYCLKLKELGLNLKSWFNHSRENMVVLNKYLVYGSS